MSAIQSLVGEFGEIDQAGLKMKTIVYTSEIADPSNAASTVEDILDTSIQNNAAREITGAMFFHTNCFLQALEGKAIHELYRKNQA